MQVHLVCLSTCNLPTTTYQNEWGAGRGRNVGIRTTIVGAIMREQSCDPPRCFFCLKDSAFIERVILSRKLAHFPKLRLVLPPLSQITFHLDVLISWKITRWFFLKISFFLNCPSPYCIMFSRYCIHTANAENFVLQNRIYHCYIL